MTAEGMIEDEVLAGLREEIAELRKSADAEPDAERRADRLRVADSREAVLEDEAEAEAIADERTV
ncbi:hypothetical protein [Umezawaea sp. Da 62-37]|uniref:hypothetical protein n=1 Tax=Umezawaea sp. Da 62-37 TaxID=3075927 RepID=UPI0028F74797|nr:hypothetical protein [Umezawaea sp. Da 62-37]WNV89866.1 hypothetical protein RM788_16665 [Umezawaea sp. Da 62-37]